MTDTKLGLALIAPWALMILAIGCAPILDKAVSRLRRYFKWGRVL